MAIRGAWVDVRIGEVETPGQLAEVRAMFAEYGALLRERHAGVCMGAFEEETLTLPGAYAPPAGALLIAERGGTAIGCVGLRPLAPACGEMKRLYVRPEARGTGAGRQLVQAILDVARRRGMDRVRLDTLPHMTEAIALYRSFGFRPIEEYAGDHPPGSICYERVVEKVN
jgi:ribosomal protein S18 acetylase RimI-like enzyme